MYAVGTLTRNQTDVAAYTTAAAPWLCVVVLTLSGIAVVGNVLVLATVVLTPSLRRPNVALTVSLAVADVLRAVVVSPIFAFLTRPQGAALGRVLRAVDAAFTSVSSATVATIAAERLFLFARPLTYQRLVRWRHLAVVVGTIWTIGCGYGVVVGCVDSSNAQPHRDVLTALPRSVIWMHFTLTFSVPLVVMTACYVKIFFIVQAKLRTIAPLGSEVSHYSGATRTYPVWPSGETRANTATEQQEGRPVAPPGGILKHDRKHFPVDVRIVISDDSKPTNNNCNSDASQGIQASKASQVINPAEEETSQNIEVVDKKTDDDKVVGRDMDTSKTGPNDTLQIDSEQTLVNDRKRDHSNTDSDYRTPTDGEPTQSPVESPSAVLPPAERPENGVGHQALLRPAETPPAARRGSKRGSVTFRESGVERDRESTVAASWLHLAAAQRPSTSSLAAVSRTSSSSLRERWRRSRFVERLTRNKAAKMAAAVVGTFAACWLPHQVAALCGGGGASVAAWLYAITFASAVANPAIYDFYSGEFRDATAKLLRRFAHVASTR